MSGKVIHILSTKPLEQPLIDKAARNGVMITNASFINIKKALTNEAGNLIRKLGDEKINAVFTSMNAVEIVVEALDRSPDKMPEWNIYCIGGSSFTLIKKYWIYDRIKGSGKNASELALRIIDDKISEVHFFCGNSRREELPSLLKGHHIRINEHPVYETELTPVKVVDSYDGILFFSPSAAESFFKVNTPTDGTIHFAVGKTTGKTLKGFSTNEIVCSEFPAKEQLLESVLNYYKQQ